MYDYQIFTSYNSDLKKIWKELEENSIHYIFQTYDWNNHWHNMIGEPQNIKPVIVVVKENSKPVALFPLTIKNIYFIKILEFSGGILNDYNMPLIKTQSNFIKQFKTNWEEIIKILPKYDIRLFRKIPQIYDKKKGYFYKSWTPNCMHKAFAMDLPKSTELLRKRLSKNLISNISRKNRRLSELGNVKFVISQTDLDYKKITEQMIAQKRQRYLQTGVRDVLKCIYIQNFYRQFNSNNSEELKIHVSALKLGNKIIATHWGVIHNNILYWLMPTHSYKYQKYSPGRLLIDRLLTWAIENKIESFDFTIGDDQYKKEYCNRESVLYDNLQSNTILGLPFIKIYQLIHYIKTTKKIKRLLMTIVTKYRLIFTSNKNNITQ